MNPTSPRAGRPQAAVHSIALRTIPPLGTKAGLQLLHDTEKVLHTDLGLNVFQKRYS